VRTTGGTCIHCGWQVERNDDGVLVTHEPGAPDLATCGSTGDLPHQVDEEEDR
jgi:hypothetical protein